MRLVEIAHTIREACEVLIQPKLGPYTLHLEAEVVRLGIEKLRLEGKCDLLQLKLETALAPKPVPAPVKREIQRVVPPISTWDLYLAEQMRLQEIDELASTNNKIQPEPPSPQANEKSVN